MQPPRKLEDYMVTDGSDSSMAMLNFPPTEISRLPTDTYVEADPEKINTFLYPCDFPRRNYQFEISQECIKHNTLVCLPTGTGKTFIAAVVIMNFYRWYPNGTIIFCAPTRALVEQQITACNQFTLIPDKETTIFTGTKRKEDRKKIWKNYKVIYATPQIIQFELERGNLDATRVSLIVFDEAHHARSKHSYCMITRMIAERSSQFRIVGLTATPGKDMASIQAVIYNLMISKVIYKDETDQDVAQYQHNTDVEIITVPLGGDETALSDLLNQCIAFIANKVQVLLSVTDPNFLTKGIVFMTMSRLKNGEKGTGFFSKMSNLGILMTLTSMKEKLQKYGPSFLDKALNDFEGKKQSPEKRALMDFEPFKKLKKSSTATKRSSHPKLAKLSVILEDFFAKNTDSRCIVFTNFRDVAQDIASHVKMIPNVKASVFTGKGTTMTDEGQSENMQHAIVDLFRKGNINLIVATCIAEEGLDIGEVDLIICYDTQSSPLRTVQRMGRTGRKRAGKVIFLMAEGVEEKQLAKAVNKKNDVKALLTDQKRFVTYQPAKPNLPVPDDIRCIKLTCGKTRATTSNSMSSPNLSGKKSKPTLSETELLELNAVMGKQTRFRKVKLDISKAAAGTKIKVRMFSHSAESLLLNSFAMNYQEDIPDSIDDEISKLFGETNDKNESSDSDAYDSQPCIRPPEFKYERAQPEESPVKQPELETPKVSPKKITFIDSSDDDFVSKPQKPVTSPTNYYRKETQAAAAPQQTKQFSFLSDTDSDSDYIDEQAIERIVSGLEEKSNGSNDYEPEGFTTKVVRQSSVIQQPKTTQLHFLSSSSDDDDDGTAPTVDPYVKKQFNFISDSD